MTPDCIEKQILLQAPMSRVWDAIADARHFGAWFGMAFDGPFVVGQALTGHIVPTTVDAEVAALQAPHRGTPCLIVVDAIEPLTRFAFRWHPYALAPDSVADEPMTLVEFLLTPQGDGVLLTIRESGFENIPLQRRAEAFASNDGGWTHQAQLIARYLTMTA